MRRHSSESEKRRSPWAGPAYRLRDYLHPLSAIKRGDEIVLALRVSTRAQRRKGGLRDQEASLRALVSERGARVVEVVGHVGSGADAGWLLPAFALAKRRGATVLAESLSRYVRNRFYGSGGRGLRATKGQLEGLLRAAGGVPLCVVRLQGHNGGERSIQTKRGQAQKKAKGGRGHKTRLLDRQRQFRDKWLPYVSRLSGDGFNQTKIAEILTRTTGTKVCQSTVSKWLRFSNTHSNSTK